MKRILWAVSVGLLVTGCGSPQVREIVREVSSPPPSASSLPQAKSDTSRLDYNFKIHSGMKGAVRKILASGQVKENDTVLVLDVSEEASNGVIHVTQVDGGRARGKLVLDSTFQKIAEDGLVTGLVGSKIKAIGFKLNPKDLVAATKDLVERLKAFKEMGWNVSYSEWKSGSGRLDHILYSNPETLAQLWTLKETYKATKLLTYRWVTYEESRRTDGDAIVIRFHARVIDPETGVVLWADLVEAEGL